MSESELDKVTEVNQKFLSGMKILMSGQKLWHRSDSFKAEIGLCKTMEEGAQLYFIMGDTVVGLDWSLDYIYQWLSKIPDEEITVGLANKVLTETHHKAR